MLLENAFSQDEISLDFLNLSTVLRISIDSKCWLKNFRQLG